MSTHNSECLLPNADQLCMEHTLSLRHCLQWHVRALSTEHDYRHPHNLCFAKIGMQAACCKRITKQGWMCQLVGRG